MSYLNRLSQNVVIDTNNSSTSNLAGGASFTGTYTSTTGVAGIQVTLKTDQNCTVLIEQSPDHINWDVVDTFTYYYSINNFSRTVQAVNSYVRVIVTNLSASTTTTYFRLQTALCPIVEAVPRSTDEWDNLKTTINGITDDYGFAAENTPMGEMRMVEPFRLVGATFEGTTIDPNFWVTSATGTGAAIAQGNAQLLFTSGTGSGAVVTAYTNRRARYVGGSAMRYRTVRQLDAGTANNKRRFGVGWGASMPTVTDGAYFQLSGTIFSVVTCKGGVETVVSSGSFNGTLGATYTPGTGVLTYEIYWTNSKVYFVIGGILLHTVSATSATWANTMNFHAFADSVNSGTATSVTMATRVATIYRLGKAETAPKTYYQHGANAGAVLKYGPGRLKRVIVNASSNSTTFSLYDNTTNSNPIALSTFPSSAVPTSIDYDLDFYTGLYLVTAGTATDLLVIYE